MQLLRYSAVPQGSTIIGGVNSKNLHHAVDARHVYTDGTHVTDDRSCRKPSMPSLSQKISVSPMHDVTIKHLCRRELVVSAVRAASRRSNRSLTLSQLVWPFGSY